MRVMMIVMIMLMLLNTLSGNRQKHCDNEGDDDCNDYKHCKNVKYVEYLVGQ